MNPHEHTGSGTLGCGVAAAERAAQPPMSPSTTPIDGSRRRQSAGSGTARDRCSRPCATSRSNSSVLICSSSSARTAHDAPRAPSASPAPDRSTGSRLSPPEDRPQPGGQETLDRLRHLVRLRHEHLRDNSLVPSFWRARADGHALETPPSPEGEGGGMLTSALDPVVHVGDTALPLEDPGAL
jgi:hypothetical protein